MSDERVNAPSWEVMLPARGAAKLGGPKPKGTLVIQGSDGGEERITVPTAVARMLRAKQKSGEVKVGSRAELLAVVGQVCQVCAHARLERLIDRREYARSEIEQKLRLDGYARKTIDACLDRACAAGLVSDERFADAFIRSKLYAGWGMQRIERELARRGIDAAQVVGWPYEYLDPDDELSRALEVAGRRSVSGPRAYEKLVRYLCGRGFAVGVATRAARQALEQRAAEE